MQLYPILLVAVIIAADSGARWDSAPAESAPWMTVLWVTAPMLAVLLAAQALTWRLRRRMDRGSGPRSVIAADRVARLTRAMVVLHHVVAVLALGWLDVVRSAVGDLILIDEIIAIGPAMLGLMGTWWVFYPIERRLRESILLRRLDEGLPVHPVPGRAAYVLLQTRLQVLFLLVPVLLIAGVTELGRLAQDRWLADSGAMWLVNAGSMLAVAAVFIFGPALARLVLDVRRLEDGELRRQLQAVCDRHAVRVREILVWNTSGMMINAAVMGLLGRLRFVLMTDALLESMSPRQLEAVMAHEVGHVRRHHIPWLVAIMLAVVLAAALALAVPIRTAVVTAQMIGLDISEAATVAANAFQIALAMLVFGWVSRRFERQADTFAVQHLSGLGALPPTSEGRITPEAVETMREALASIARLNGIPPNRSSWRHGSIAWRMAYLSGLSGQPIESLPIDRQVRWLKRAALAVLVLAGAMWWALSEIQNRWLEPEESTLVLRSDRLKSTS
jgi:STE24 endopeptidase